MSDSKYLFIDHCGLFANGQLTTLGKKYFAGHDNWQTWLDDSTKNKLLVQVASRQGLQEQWKTTWPVELKDEDLDLNPLPLDKLPLDDRLPKFCVDHDLPPVMDFVTWRPKIQARFSVKENDIKEFKTSYDWAEPFFHRNDFRFSVNGAIDIQEHKPIETTVNNIQDVMNSTLPFAGRSFDKTMLKALSLQCATCRKASPPFRCSRCKIIHYCDRKCQKKGWRLNHKKQCLS